MSFRSHFLDYYEKRIKYLSSTALVNTNNHTKKGIILPHEKFGWNWKAFIWNGGWGWKIITFSEEYDFELFNFYSFENFNYEVLKLENRIIQNAITSDFKIPLNEMSLKILGFHKKCNCMFKKIVSIAFKSCSSLIGHFISKEIKQYAKGIRNFSSEKMRLFCLCRFLYPLN